MKCSNCKYWKRQVPTPNHIPDEGFGDCSNPKFIYGKSDTIYYPFDRTLEQNYPVDALLYRDYENYMAWFETGENFGCIHFEEIK
jgi:hypothetical protein